MSDDGLTEESLKELAGTICRFLVTRPSGRVPPAAAMQSDWKQVVAKVEELLANVEGSSFSFVTDVLSSVLTPQKGLSDSDVWSRGFEKFVDGHSKQFVTPPGSKRKHPTSGFLPPVPTTEPAAAARTPELQPRPDADSDGQLAEYRERVQALENENRELRTQVSSSRTGSQTGELCTVLAFLGVEDAPGVPPQGEAAACDHLRKEVHRYYRKTRDNLLQVFDELEIPVEIEPFPDAVAKSVSSGDSLRPYLDGVRYSWQELAAGTWNNLKQWCNELGETLDPEKIEAEAKSYRQKPWEYYCDLIQKISLYHNLIERLQSHIWAGVKKRTDFLR